MTVLGSIVRRLPIGPGFSYNSDIVSKVEISFHKMELISFVIVFIFCKDNDDDDEMVVCVSGCEAQGEAERDESDELETNG